MLYLSPSCFSTGVFYLSSILSPYSVFCVSLLISSWLYFLKYFAFPGYHLTCFYFLILKEKSLMCPQIQARSFFTLENICIYHRCLKSLSFTRKSSLWYWDILLICLFFICASQNEILNLFVEYLFYIMWQVLSNSNTQENGIRSIKIRKEESKAMYFHRWFYYMLRQHKYLMEKLLQKVEFSEVAIYKINM